MVRSTSATLADSRFAIARSRLGGAQKSTVSVPAYLRFVNRRAGGWLAALAYAADLTPTQVTVLSAASSFAGIAVLLFAPANVGVGIGVAALLLLGYALDSADGQLARVRGGGSKAGEWLDHVVDMAKLSSLHAAVAVSILRFFDVSWLALALPLVFGIANATQFLGMMLRDQLRASAEQTAQPNGDWLVLGAAGLAAAAAGSRRARPGLPAARLARRVPGRLWLPGAVHGAVLAPLAGQGLSRPGGTGPARVTRVSGAEPAPHPLAGLARGGSFAVLGTGAGSVLGFALTLVVTHGLTTTTAGQFFSATAVFIVLQTFLSFGVGAGLVRFVPRFRALDRTEDVPALLVVAFVPVAVLGVLGASACGWPRRSWPRTSATTTRTRRWPASGSWRCSSCPARSRSPRSKAPGRSAASATTC